MNIKYNKALWIVTILAIVMLIPFLVLYCNYICSNESLLAINYYSGVAIALSR